MAAVVDLTNEDEEWEWMRGQDYDDDDVDLEVHDEAWEDPDFPANRRSIEGEQGVDASRGGVPWCRCKMAAERDVVKSDTPNRGREYFRCGKRKCGFFSWCERKRREVSWKKFTEFDLVTDYGFCGVTQGKLGDCWFLSALSVVAERFDLFDKLFLRRDASPFVVRFFLDGRWEKIYVDSSLPSSDGSVAFVKSFCQATQKQTLWASILEKAYAKWHGSYSALDGGQIAEALQALTGAATLCIKMPWSFRALDDLFVLLERWKNEEDLPMGCATDSATDDGLNSCHAYSVLAVEQYPEGRLVWVRDPHGTSQFPKYGRVATAVRERDPNLLQRNDDGTFFIDYDRFAAAFSRIDVALAWKKSGNHARSVDMKFPLKSTQTRTCDAVVAVTTRETATIAVSALQPAKRGSKDRSDRKKSYKPGDISIVVVVDERVVAASIRGAEVGEFSSSLVFRLLPYSTCTIFCYSLGKNPAAAKDTTDGQPFVVRLDSNVEVRYASRETDYSKAVSNLLTALTVGVVDHRHCLLKIPNDDTVRTVSLGSSVSCTIRISDGLCAVVATNESSDRPQIVEVVVYAKSAVARADDIVLLQGDATKAVAYAATATPDSARFKWPAKWKQFSSTRAIPPRCRQILLVVVRSGVQWRLGDVDCKLRTNEAREVVAPTPPANRGKFQSTLRASWKGDTQRLVKGVFASYPIPLKVTAAPSRSSFKRSREHSVSVVQEDTDAIEAAQLRRAIQLSLQGSESQEQEEDEQLRAVLEMSRWEAAPNFTT